MKREGLGRKGGRGRYNGFHPDRDFLKFCPARPAGGKTPMNSTPDYSQAWLKKRWRQTGDNSWRSGTRNAKKLGVLPPTSLICDVTVRYHGAVRIMVRVTVS